jgi:preprotein translocase subunit YajC
MPVHLLLQAGAPGANPFSQIILLALIMIIFFFFMIYPQIRQRNKEKKFRDNLKVGDKIVTIGGIYGKIAKIEDTQVLIEVDDRVKLRMEKTAIRASAEAENPPKGQTKP